jgi:phage shock protein PspC (stress-responsive transcriptional regulator)
MKKTHSANIGGTVFQVEEDAYERLQAYLQSIEAHFDSYPDVADIVADIEGRIAEQLLQRELAPQVVRMSDVERVIEAMGHIEQFDEQEAAPPAPGQVRKLFRDPDNKVIAGVAAGLASYLGVPRLLVRVLFLLAVPLFGTALVVYLLLWVLTPVASSTTDKLQMRGRPLTLASIDKGVRDGIASIPRETRNMATRGVMAAGSLIHLVVVSIARALKWIAGVFVVGFATLTLLTFTVLLVVALVNPSAAPLHPGVAGFFAAFGSWQEVFKIFAYLLVVIPLALVITTALKLFWGVNRLNTRGLAGLLGTWVVALLATTVIWSSSYPQLNRYMEDYPAMAEARRGLEKFNAQLATTSPLSEEQSRALTATLVAESKRLRAENDQHVTYPWGDPRAQLELAEGSVKARETSNRRIFESARAYLDAQQLAVMQDSMTQYSARAQARLQARREELKDVPGDVPGGRRPRF